MGGPVRRTMAEDPAQLPRDLAGLAARIRVCTLCPLREGRTHAVPGEGTGRATLFLVGEAPGRAEDREGRPFRGAAGRILWGALQEAGIPRRRVFVTNVVRCRPRGNRKPRAAEMAACHPYLTRQIGIVRPRVIVALGQTALRDLAGAGVALSEARGTWAGWNGTPILATYHPAAVLYNRRLLPTLVADLRKARRRAEGR